MQAVLTRVLRDEHAFLRQTGAKRVRDFVDERDDDAGAVDSDANDDEDGAGDSDGAAGERRLDDVALRNLLVVFAHEHRCVGWVGTIGPT